jgi:hypothetical protein
LVQLSVIGVMFSDTVASAMRVRVLHIDDAPELVQLSVIRVIWY